jgi:tetratricopeptide (TPR) repeat protein
VGEPLKRSVRLLHWLVLENSMSKTSNNIEALIDADDWRAARKAITVALRKESDSHWLLSRLALTHYEEFNYEKALEIEARALKLAPHCPLVLWGYAGTLEMLGREREALRMYRSLIRRGAESIAHGECGEGIGKARGLVADCFYRLAGSYEALGQRRRAMKAFEHHLDLRGPGCFSIYPLKDLLKEQDHLRKKRVHRKRAI